MSAKEKARKYAERKSGAKRYGASDLYGPVSRLWLQRDMEAAFLAGYRAAKREAK